MNDEQICGERSPEDITCILLPDHPTKTHAGLRADCSVVMWPQSTDHEPQHRLES